MVIGNVIEKVFSNEENKEIKFIEMLIRPPFMKSEVFVITHNKKKDNENAPDWYINYSYNKKDENFRRVRVGALWNKKKDEVEYKTGFIETPAIQGGKIYITLFKAKQFEGEKQAPNWLYDVIWNVPQQHKEETVTTADIKQNSQQTTVKTLPTSVEDIPF
jgi:uncharacterized protein (DUF736 family)